MSESISASAISISWEAPFSLDLTTAEPDIQYCVDVYNVTGERGDIVESSCDITETSYTFTPNNPSPDHLFNPLQAKFLPQKWPFQALNKLLRSPVDYSQCIGQA